MTVIVLVVAIVIASGNLLCLGWVFVSFFNMFGRIILY